MSGNSRIKGGTVCQCADPMGAYDALPRPIREALANAANDWAAFSILRAFKRAGARDPRSRASYWVREIARWDRNEMKRWSKAQ